jgi:hypothetical protein
VTYHDIAKVRFFTFFLFAARPSTSTPRELSDMFAARFRAASLAGLGRRMFQTEQAAMLSASLKVLLFGLNV